MPRRTFGVWMAIIALAVISPVARSAGESPSGVTKIDIEQFDHLRHEKNHVVLDVRTKQEFESGHVPGAMNIDISDPQFRRRIGALDKSKCYLVHCASGVRSERATRIMSALGFGELFDFHGGFRAWKQARKPIEKGDSTDAGSK